MNLELEEAFQKLGELEDREFFAIESGQFDRLPDIRRAMIPIKQEINRLEGFPVYDVPNEETTNTTKQ
jgi:hypothetical protein